MSPSVLSARAIPSGLTLSVFPLEWLALSVLAVADAIWSAAAGFSFTAGLATTGFPLAALACAFSVRVWGKHPWAAQTGEYIALSGSAILAFGAMSYLCCAVGRPLADAALLHFDRALGFDWLYWFDLLRAHRMVLAGLRIAYDSMPYQAIYFAVLFGLLGDRARLREMFWIVFVAGLFTSAGSVFVPALGAFKAFGLDRYGDYLPVMEQLRSGTDLHFAFAAMTGVVSFPSFHTTMALVYVYGFRGTGTVGRVMAGLNIAMLFAIPFFGGHYLADMLAGAVVALLSVIMARRITTLSGPVWWPIQRDHSAPSGI